MIRLLPLNFISLLILLFFFKVSFLTQKKVENVTDNLNEQIGIYNQLFEEDRDEILQKIIQENKKIEHDKKALNLRDLKKQGIYESTSKKIQNNNEGKIIINSLPRDFKQFGVQFGVYKIKNNILKAEKIIENKLKNFSNDIDLTIVEDKNLQLFRLMLITTNFSFANEVCTYTKSINLECYVKKKE